jgi:hypothetical protein
MVICCAASVQLTDTVRNPLGYYRTLRLARQMETPVKAA